MNRRLTTAVAATAVVIACSPGVGPPRSGAGAASSVPTAIDVEATVAQDLSSQARGVIQVTFRNSSGQPASFTSLRLDDPRFAVPEATARSVTLPTERLLMVPITFGTARCDDRPPDPPRIAVTGGTLGAVGVPVDAKGRTFLRRLHGEQCQRQAVLDAVDIGFADFAPAGEDASRGVLRLTRRKPGAAVTVTDLAGNLIFTRGPADLPLTLAAGQRTAELAVELSASRCDAHVLTGYTKTFVFRTWVQLGDQPERTLELKVDGPVRDVLTEAMRTGCAPR